MSNWGVVKMEALNPAEAKVMRAIEARERKVALAERRAAQAAHREQNRPSPSTVGWSTKAPPKRKPSAAERAIADEVAQRKLLWAQRHRDLARSERALRVERAAMLKRWDHKREGTPETHDRKARNNDGPLARLWLSGSIDADQLASAVDIATVAERIQADVAIKTASLETRIQSTGRVGGAFYEALGHVRREMAYTRWRAEVGKLAGGSIAPVLDMIVGECVGFTVVAKRYRMGNKRVKKLLIDALDLWPRILGAVSKEIDPATLAAAHAGIL